MPRRSRRRGQTIIGPCAGSEARGAAGATNTATDEQVAQALHGHEHGRGEQHEQRDVDERARAPSAARSGRSKPTASSRPCERDQAPHHAGDEHQPRTAGRCRRRRARRRRAVPCTGRRVGRQREQHAEAEQPGDHHRHRGVAADGGHLRPPAAMAIAATTSRRAAEQQRHARAARRPRAPAAARGPATRRCRRGRRRASSSPARRRRAEQHDLERGRGA